MALLYHQREHINRKYILKRIVVCCKATEKLMEFLLDVNVKFEAQNNWNWNCLKMKIENMRHMHTFNNYVNRLINILLLPFLSWLFWSSDTVSKHLQQIHFFHVQQTGTLQGLLEDRLKMVFSGLNTEQNQNKLHYFTHLNNIQFAVILSRCCICYFASKAVFVR